MSGFITLEEAKLYLRMDSSDEDATVSSLLAASEKLCMDVARLSATEWDAVTAVEEGGTVNIRGEDYSYEQALLIQDLMRTSILFGLGYLFEHREEGDHHGLVMTLRNLLFSIREGEF